MSWRQILALVLLLAGLALTAFTKPPFWPAPQAVHFQFAAAGAAALLALIPPVRRIAGRLLDRLRQPSPRVAWLTAIVLSLVCSQYLVFTGLRQGRDYLPKLHDEQMYLLQARMLLAGRLWMPAHQLPQFFETFHVLVRPVYAPIYFPGTALAYAPALAVGMEPAILSSLLCGAIIGLTYLIFTQLIDGAAGLLAALMMLGLGYLHFLALMVMSHTLALLLGLGLFWAMLQWRRRGAAGWALAVGILAGWAAITRPFDALCFAVPAGFLMLWELRGRPAGRVATTLGALVAGAVPFLALQLVMNRGITGRYFQTPASMYAQMYWPQLSLGFAEPDPQWRPPTQLAQFQDYYRDFMLPELHKHAEESLARLSVDRWPVLCTGALPSLAALALLPVGLAGLRERRLWALWAMLPLFWICYLWFPFFLPHYAPVAAPAMILSVLLGRQVLMDVFPGRREAWAAATALGLAAASLTSLTELNPYLHDPPFQSRTLADVSLKLDKLPPDQRAVVLFHYDSPGDYHEEPVYNLTTACPDDAAIVRAHDLGPRENLKIFRYYARLQPDRVFYLYDRAARTLTRLGTAKELGR